MERFFVALFLKTSEYIVTAKSKNTTTHKYRVAPQNDKWGKLMENKRIIKPDTPSLHIVH